jgi:deferrochelatase/peroxidase EfeB
MSGSLPQLLAKPIRWQDWLTDQDVHALLSDLQANILKGHGRDHTGNIFVSFGGMPADKVAHLLRRLAPLVTSALGQLREVDAFKATHVPGGRVVCLFLARGAYEKLGVPENKRPGDAAFRAGMRVRGQLPQIPFAGLPPLPGLNDPPPNRWGGGPWSAANPEPDAMVLVADDDPGQVTAGLEAMERVLDGSGARVLGVERGLAQRRKQEGGSPKGEGLEQFGYVDGRSQPLFLQEDLDGEPREVWDPAFPPSQFLVHDPMGRGAFSCGSYFVFRKLEQNVKRFKVQEDELAEALGLQGEEAERAGALVVGRFEDGTPVVASGEPKAGNPVNDFDFKGDPNGELCPFRGHIRKTNPRGESDPGPGRRPPGLRAERERLMARRGITYGQRAPRPEGADFPEDDRPERDVGLLFMAYMADIQEQFEFTQAAWAGNGDFVRPNTGIDPVIGQRDNRPGTADLRWRDGRSGGQADFDFKTAIGLQGGEYFFAPSIGFLYGPRG